jgi:hypothetical protein
MDKLPPPQALPLRNLASTKAASQIPGGPHLFKVKSAFLVPASACVR